jgi:hypothetical protein
VLAVTIGSFGDRFAKIASIFRPMSSEEVPWGEAADHGLAQRPVEPVHRVCQPTPDRPGAGPLRELLLTTVRLRRRPLPLVDGSGKLGACVQRWMLGDRPGGERQPEGVDGLARIDRARS